MKAKPSLVGSALDGDAALFSELVELLPETGARYITALGEAVQHVDRIEIARTAHGLKSAVCYLDQGELAPVCSALEMQAGSATVESIQNLYQEILSSYARLLDRIQAESVLQIY